MTDTFATSGFVATDPRENTSGSGDAITSFRLASMHRRFNRELGAWEDTQPNWFTINCYRKLAQNAAQSLRKGDRIVVRGKLRVRDWDNGDRSGTSMEIDADSLGHDLLFGTSSFERTTHTPETEEEKELDPELQPA